MQDSDHAVDEAEPRTVHFEQAAALAFVYEVLFVGIAERKKDRIRADLARESHSNVCPQCSIVSGK
jgi:hypothetical protein